MSAPELTVDDAIGIIVEHVKERPREVRNYGYDVYLPYILNLYLIAKQPVIAGDQNALDEAARGLSSIFYVASWELCRRGIMRPGVWRHGEQATDNCQGGDGYSLTPSGREWLASADPLLFIPTEPSRLGAMLAGFTSRFGPGFNQRAQEAAKCYFATAYLACCAMAGAAAESILLAAAIAQRGDEAAVLGDYRASGGRARVEKRLLGQVGEPTKSRFHTFMDLLSYWRDDSAHGTVTTISDIEAYDALSRLVRMAHFVSDHWGEVTGK